MLFPAISDVSMQDSLMHMVDILLSYVFSTNPKPLVESGVRYLASSAWSLGWTLG